MNDYIPFLLISFFIISNTVAFYNIYKSRLQYLQPSKGYLFSLLLVTVFVAFDYSVYSFATTASTNTSKHNYTRFYVENTLNKLADAEILEEDKDVLVEDLMQMFSTNDRIVTIQKSDSIKGVRNSNMTSSRLEIDDYVRQLRFSKQSNIIKVKTLSTNELGKIEFLQVSM